MFNKYIKIIYILLMIIATSTITNASNNVYKHSFIDIEGNELNLNHFQGKPILLVNTASKCGFTPQYGDLQKLFQKYKDTDLIFIATPSNDFKQEYSSENEILFINDEIIDKWCFKKFLLKFRNNLMYLQKNLKKQSKLELQLL